MLQLHQLSTLLYLTNLTNFLEVFARFDFFSSVRMYSCNSALRSSKDWISWVYVLSAFSNSSSSFCFSLFKFVHYFHSWSSMLISSYSSVSLVIEISSSVKTLNSTTFESSFFLSFSFIVFTLRNYFFYFHIGIFFFNRRLDSFVTAQQVPGTEAFSKSFELKGGSIWCRLPWKGVP